MVKYDLNWILDMDPELKHAILELIQLCEGKNKKEQLKIIKKWREEKQEEGNLALLIK